MPMPSGDEVQRSLAASWRLMMGRAEAIRMLDLSADGFWNSFFAFLVAIPPLFAVWTAEAIEIAPTALGYRIGLVVELAIIEIAASFIPILLVAFGLYRAGRKDRIIAFVVANNWGSALLTWVVVPVILIVTLVPATAEGGAVLLFMLLLASLYLSWRLNDSVLGMGPIVPTLIVAATVFVSITIDYLLRMLFLIPLSGQSG